MRRRELIKLLGGGAAAPLVLWQRASHAQPPPMPVLGFLNVESSQGYAAPLAAFLKGLGEAGYVDGRDVVIEYRWAEGHDERLPEMAADLVRKRVTVIAATSTLAAIAAKAATTTIPVVFETAADPIQLGLVPSLNRPGGNITGVTQTNLETAPKQLELMHELLPTASVLGLLINPAHQALADVELKDFTAAAHTLRLELRVLNARDDRELENAFADLSQSKVGGLVIGTNTFFTSHAAKLAALATRYAMPAAYKGHEFAAAGGLISYGSDPEDSYRLAGAYTGRVLNGDKPADLPIQQATKVELIINLKTAKALGLSIPLALVGRADEIIE